MPINCVDTEKYNLISLIPFPETQESYVCALVYVCVCVCVYEQCSRSCAYRSGSKCSTHACHTHKGEKELSSVRWIYEPGLNVWLRSGQQGYAHKHTPSFICICLYLYALNHTHIYTLVGQFLHTPTQRLTQRSLVGYEPAPQFSKQISLLWSREHVMREHCSHNSTQLNHIHANSEPYMYISTYNIESRARRDKYARCLCSARRCCIFSTKWLIIQSKSVDKFGGSGKHSCARARIYVDDIFLGGVHIVVR